MQAVKERFQVIQRQDDKIAQLNSTVVTGREHMRSIIGQVEKVYLYTQEVCDHLGEFPEEIKEMGSTSMWASIVSLSREASSLRSLITDTSSICTTTSGKISKQATTASKQAKTLAESIKITIPDLQTRMAYQEELTKSRSDPFSKWTRSDTSVDTTKLKDMEKSLEWVKRTVTQL